MIQQAPVIIDIRQAPESEFAQLSDVLLGTLGIAGLLVLIAVILGGLLAGAMFWLRSRS